VGGGGGAQSAYFQTGGQRYADDLEGQNDEAIEGLSKKVKLLKDVRYNFLLSRLLYCLFCGPDGGNGMLFLLFPFRF